MNNSLAHKNDMNHIGEVLFADGSVPWRDAQPPDLSDINRLRGTLRSCGYCGSMHPTDLVAVIQSGATVSFADMKYGWPHKLYVDNIPNPYAGMLEIVTTANFAKEGFIRGGSDWWYEPPKPAPAKTYGKFYIVHLIDATPEEKQIIEHACGLAFEFKDDAVRWKIAP